MFLMRMLFTMFAEDVGLLPKDSFQEVLTECGKARHLPRPDDRPLAGHGRRRFSPRIRAKVRRSTASSSRTARPAPLRRRSANSRRLNKLAGRGAGHLRHVAGAGA